MADATAALDMDELRTFVADVLDVDEEDVTDDADFVKTLGVDSLMALEVMVVLEKKYSVKLEEREMKDITTLRKVHDLLASKMGE
ncbi:acyl carrier protein [Streptomyces sp. 5-10]|uniref:acyl carrier protein n=1 Tax=Streptomyces sp. 5-10 TaxID=878925 RepID=UPI00168B7718|nr:acyl carrier protein [Streptomyces sp. 5-10]MBD3010964.1 acyl carrier protein [Streptomyces sp. 5-10]